MDKLIITCAITGSLPRKKDNPATPISSQEQVQSWAECYLAGASILHFHVRDDTENPCLDKNKFQHVIEVVRKSIIINDTILQPSTGGRSGAGIQRGCFLDLQPEMASLTPSSVKLDAFSNGVYENPSDLVDYLAKKMLEYNVKPELEIFSEFQINDALRLRDKNYIKEPIHFQFVFGIKGPDALDASEKKLDQLIAKLPNGSTWTCAGVGRYQLEVNKWAIKHGGHVRTGFEDNIKYDKDTLANSNAQLVERIVRLSKESGRAIATPKEARQMLNLPY
ncbi:3-keto-5-aminohexanoate cleavage protein [Candidatus Woesearchaeota archaeon]|nr:3-keto-5-aminohexanoate cleavage protein [Candidatus Woesearchaeota archaeon]